MHIGLAASVNITVSSTNSDPRIKRVDALMHVVLFPLGCCLPKTVVSVLDITVVDGHHLVARNFNTVLFHDDTAKVLNNSPVGIFTV